MKRIAVAVADDADVLASIDETVKRGLAEAILIGDAAKIHELAEENQYELKNCEIVDRPDHKDAAETAVALIRSQDAQVLMKGNIQTSILMRAVLNKEKGIRAGKTLHSVTVIDSPLLDRLIFLSDPGIVPCPTFEQKIEIINNTVNIVRRLGIKEPKVACLSAVEAVNPSIPSSMEAAALAVMGQRGQFKNCVVDGPLAMDNAIIDDAVKHKKVESATDVPGNADILIVPNVEMGNGIMKTARFLGGCGTAGLLAGASVPVAMTSRADSAIGKLRSIAIAIVAAE